MSRNMTVSNKKEASYVVATVKLNLKFFAEWKCGSVVIYV